MNSIIENGLTVALSAQVEKCVPQGVQLVMSSDKFLALDSVELKGDIKIFLTDGLMYSPVHFDGCVVECLERGDIVFGEWTFCIVMNDEGMVTAVIVHESFGDLENFADVLKGLKPRKQAMLWRRKSVDCGSLDSLDY